LRALSWLGIVWDLKTPPEHVLRNEQRLGSRVIARAAEELAARFNSERIALALTSALHGAERSALWEALVRTGERTGAAIIAHPPQLPSREELLAEAKILFAKTRSLDEIVNRAYEILLASVGMHLAAFSADRP
jgi:stearoyl-CoA desaturase (delta-9 desaturase)